jgi:hypothetical protein
MFWGQEVYKVDKEFSFIFSLYSLCRWRGGGGIIMGRGMNHPFHLHCFQVLVFIFFHTHTFRAYWFPFHGIEGFTRYRFLAILYFKIADIRTFGTINTETSQLLTRTEIK